MEVASREKNQASFSGSPPQKDTKPPGCPFSSIPVKKFQTSSAIKFATFQIRCVATTSSLHNINWLSKKV